MLIQILGVHAMMVYGTMLESDSIRGAQFKVYAVHVSFYFNTRTISFFFLTFLHNFAVSTLHVDD